MKIKRIFLFFLSSLACFSEFIYLNSNNFLLVTSILETGIILMETTILFDYIILSNWNGKD